MKKFIQNDNNLAIAYYRYSSHNQNEESIDQQRLFAEKYAESRGLTIVREYADMALTGTDFSNRPQFQLMMSEVKQIKPAYLIVWKTDRIGRSRYELVDAKKKLKDNGVLVHSISENMAEGTPENILIESVLEGMAEYYAHQLASNLERSLKYNAEKGLFFQKIYGYKKGEDKHYIVDNDSAPVVVRIFNEYANGKGMVEICDELNSQGVKTGIGKPFTVNGLRSILRNRKYTGEYKYMDVVIPGGMPAIISEDLWDKAQKRLQMNKRVGGQKAAGLDEDGTPRYWLTGKLYCGHCEQPMHGMHGTSKTRRKYYYYSCNHHRLKHGKCDKKDVPKDLIENAVLKALSGILDDTANLASLAVDISDYYQRHYSDDSYLRALENELKNTQTALNNLVKALEKGIFSDTTQARLTELENQKTALSETILIEQAKQHIKIDQFSVGEFFKKYENADLKNPEIRDMVLEYFVDKIFVYDDHLIVCCYYTDQIEHGIHISLDEVKGKLKSKFDGFVPSSAPEKSLVY